MKQVYVLVALFTLALSAGCGGKSGELELGDAKNDALEGHDDPASVHQIYITDSPRFTDAGLAHLAKYPNLTDLFLLDTGITGDGITENLSSTDLLFLNVRGAPLGKDSLKVIASNQRLDQLHLVDCGGVTDTSLRAFNKHPAMRILIIHGAPGVTDASLKVLTSMKLKRLHLVSTGVSSDGMSHIRAALPDCETFYD